MKIDGTGSASYTGSTQSTDSEITSLKKQIKEVEQQISELAEQEASDTVEEQQKSLELQLAELNRQLAELQTEKQKDAQEATASETQQEAAVKPRPAGLGENVDITV